MTTRHKLGLALAASIVLGLSACGSNSDDDAPAPTAQVPASASQSVDGFIDYLKALVATSPDDLEPVDVSGVTPPTTDTAEPVELN